MSSDTIYAEEGTEGTEPEDVSEKIEESIREMLTDYEKNDGTLEEDIIISIDIKQGEKEK